MLSAAFTLFMTILILIYLLYVQTVIYMYFINKPSFDTRMDYYICLCILTKIKFLQSKFEMNMTTKNKRYHNNIKIWNNTAFREINIFQVNNFYEFLRVFPISYHYLSGLITPAVYTYLALKIFHLVVP